MIYRRILALDYQGKKIPSLQISYRKEYDYGVAKDRAAVAMGKKRWADKSDEEKRAHSEAMNRARWGDKARKKKRNPWLLPLGEVHWKYETRAIPTSRDDYRPGSHSDCSVPGRAVSESPCGRAHQRFTAVHGSPFRRPDAIHRCALQLRRWEIHRHQGNAARGNAGASVRAARKIRGAGYAAHTHRERAEDRAVIIREELEICKRRGHGLKGLSSERWKQCRWCGMWLREVCVIEEREDEPPKDEQDPLGKYIG